MIQVLVNMLLHWIVLHRGPVGVSATVHRGLLASADGFQRLSTQSAPRGHGGQDSPTSQAAVSGRGSIRHLLSQDQGSLGLPSLPDWFGPWNRANWNNSLAVCSTMRQENITDVMEWLHYYQCDALSFAKALHAVNWMNACTKLACPRITLDLSTPRAPQENWRGQSRLSLETPVTELTELTCCQWHANFNSHRRGAWCHSVAGCHRRGAWCHSVAGCLRI